MIELTIDWVVLIGLISCFLGVIIGEYIGVNKKIDDYEYEIDDCYKEMQSLKDMNRRHL